MVIDLGAVPAASAERPGGAPRRADRGAVRPGVTVAVVLAVLVLGGSAAPLPGLHRVLAVENTSGAFALTPAALFTADLGRAPGREATVRRHPLDGRSAPWSTAVPQTVGSIDVVAPARVLAVGPARVLMATSVDSPRTTFLDSDTGRILWSTTTHRVLRLADAGALLAGGAGDAAELRRVDLRTGRTLWSRELGSSRHPGAGGPADPSHAPATGTTLVRPDRTDPGRTWVQITGRHHGIRTVGTVDTTAPSRCAAVADHLACPATSGRLTVWRLPAEG
jgi:hypothetical protein